MTASINFSPKAPKARASNRRSRAAEKIHPADARNQQSFISLYKALKNRPKPVGFIGAGISVEAGYPSWGALLDWLHSQAFVNKTEKSHTIRESRDGLWRAELYAAKLGKLYPGCLKKFIVRNLRKRPKLARKVAALKLGHYLTTNYENLLVDSVSKYNNRKPPVVDAQNERQMNRFLAGIDNTRSHVVFLHGTLNPLSGIILRESEYVLRYRHNPRAERDLFAVLSTRSVVFLGFSLSDPAWQELLRVFRGHPKDPARHYAILPLEEGDVQNESVLREYYTFKYGIVPIFYLPGKSHESLGAILDLLNKGRAMYKALPPIGSAVGFVPDQVKRALSSPVKDQDDPHLGRWGSSAFAKGRSVSAKVTPVDKSKSWFKIKVIVTAENKTRLEGPIWIYVHPSFSKERYRAEIAPNGLCALLTLHAYGAFTIGVSCDRGNTLLELNLAKIKGAPKRFTIN